MNSLRCKIAFLRHLFSSGFPFGVLRLLRTSALSRKNFAFNKIINPSWRRKIGIRNVESPPQTGAIVSLCSAYKAGGTPLQLSPDRPAVSSARAPAPSAYPLPARRTNFPHKEKPYIKYSSHFYLSFRKTEQPQHQKTFPFGERLLSAFVDSCCLMNIYLTF